MSRFETSWVFLKCTSIFRNLRTKNVLISDLSDTLISWNIRIILQENRSSPEAIDLTAYCRILNILRGTEAMYHQIQLHFYHYQINKFNILIGDTEKRRNMLERKSWTERQHLMMLLFKWMVKISAKSQICLTAFIVITGQHSSEHCLKTPHLW